MPDKIQRARNFVQQLFQQLDIDDEEMCETILIRNGHYCGHRFACGDVFAVWFCEEDEVKVFDRTRQLIRVEQLGIPHLRRAA